MKLDALKQAILVWGPLSEEAVQRLKAQAGPILVAECRPSLLGLKHNLPLLKKAGIDFVYCSDNCLGLLFYKKKISKTLISSKGVTEEGLRGVSGSLYAALLSKMHGVIIEVIEQGPWDLETLDKDASSLEGKDFILELDKEEYIIEQDEELIGKEVLT